MTRKSKQHTHLQDGQESGPGELQAGQPHLRCLEDYGDNPHMKDQRLTRSNYHGFTKVKFCLTKCIAFYGERGLVGKVGAVGLTLTSI